MPPAWLGGGDWMELSTSGRGAEDAFAAGGTELTHHGRALLATRVVGVGLGVFLVFFFLALSLVVCLVGSRTKYRWAIYMASTAMFGIIALVLIASPKGEKPVKPPEGYDLTIIPVVIITAVVCIGVLLGAVGMLVFHVLPTVYARPLSYHLDIMEHRN
ncbi:hypothetical protein TSOC_006146 [Tetrabaena socialis]|uniref:Uncharacterized protein n=1 Tax=Tetrabaena socialis TaxID=47790 RepID=A0A2J8A4F0_9CHLO|nr:hypothetical protein TSOC_006146 [Tetrabaena socialis]|eukprot:PNH07400.1 hypothetical protein TSOC_006146 [Tetrabaena socialis]